MLVGLRHEWLSLIVITAFSRFGAQYDVRRVSVPLSLLLPEGSTLEEVPFGFPDGSELKHGSDDNLHLISPWQNPSSLLLYISFTTSLMHCALSIIKIIFKSPYTQREEQIWIGLSLRELPVENFDVANKCHLR